MKQVDSNYIQMQVADAHVHFWNLEIMNYCWLEDVPLIKRSYGLKDYKKATDQISVTKIIFVQCECLPSEYLKEIDYITTLATQDKRIAGIVSYFPIEDPDAEVELQKLIQNPLIKGIRRLEESPVSLYTNPMFVERIDLLSENNLTFDLGVKAHQLPVALKLIEKKPNIRYMLDHFGKPNIVDGEFQQWKNHMTEIAKNPNVYCKLSGLTTEADWQNWAIDDLQPYVDVVLEYFGIDRISFGSDWPVVTLATSYMRWYETALGLCHTLTKEELNKVFYQNALNFYR